MSSSCATRPPRRSHHQRPTVAADDTADVRAGDPERKRTASRLGLAFTQGYLSMDEYETRLSQAFAAHKAGTLSQLTDDLPIDRIRRHDPRRVIARQAAARRGVRIHLFSYLAITLLAISIWAAIAFTTNTWYFWPIWPILGGGIGIVSHAIPVALVTGSNRNAGAACTDRS